jgi:Flp pilus assembly protein TadD
MPLLKFINRISRISLVFISLALFGCTTTGTNNQKVDANVESAIIDIPAQAAIDFKLAIEHMNNNKLGLAEAAFIKMSNEYPLLSGPYANLGVIYSQSNDWDKAVSMLEKASERNQKNIKILNQLGYVYRQKGAFKKAENQYLTSIKYASDDASAYLNLGILYDIYMGEFAKASKFYLHYQGLQETPDRRVAGWIVDINRRMGTVTKTTQIASEAQQ